MALSVGIGRPHGFPLLGAKPTNCGLLVLWLDSTICGAIK
jgi:hypothetical protein